MRFYGFYQGQSFRQTITETLESTKKRIDNLFGEYFDHKIDYDELNEKLLTLQESKAEIIKPKE